jgi:TPR repeat protein
MQDPDEAVEWYRKAAEKGNAEAQYNLGEMYRVGRILPKDSAEAARWLKQAADQNHLEAQVRLLQIDE